MAPTKKYSYIRHHVWSFFRRTKKADRKRAEQFLSQYGESTLQRFCWSIFDMRDDAWLMADFGMTKDHIRLLRRLFLQHDAFPSIKRWVYRRYYATNQKDTEVVD